MDPTEPTKPTDDLRALLADYRDVERMPASARAAAWRHLEAQLRPAPAPPPPRRTATRPLLVAAVLLAAAVLLVLTRPDLALRAAPTTDRDHQAVDHAPTAAPQPTTPSPRESSHPAAAPLSESSHPVAPESSHPVAPAPESSHPVAPAPVPESSHPVAPESSHPVAPESPHPVTPAPLRESSHPATPASPRPPLPSQPRAASEPPHPSAPEPSADTTSPPAAPAPPPDLEQELALLHAARTALAAPTPASVLAAHAALAEHERRFPAGILREERLRLRVEALCAAGDRDAARREATAFAAAHPASPHAKKILRLCP